MTYHRKDPAAVMGGTDVGDEVDASVHRLGIAMCHTGAVLTFRFNVEFWSSISGRSFAQT
jgi:hypothetical protein